MLNPSHPHRFRKTIAGLCMIGAPALFLAASIIGPGFDSDEAAQLALVAAERDAWLASSLLAMAGWALFLIATLGVMHMLRERSAAASHIGGGLAMIGTLSAIANTTLALVVWQMAAGGETSAMTALLAGVNESAATAIPIYFLGLGVTVGYVLLSWALYRTRIAPVFIAAPIGLAAILFAVAVLTFSQALLIAASLLALAGFAMLGRLVLGETVDEWEHQPDFRGFTPAAGAR